MYCILRRCSACESLTLVTFNFIVGIIFQKLFSFVRTFAVLTHFIIFIMAHSVIFVFSIQWAINKFSL